MAEVDGRPVIRVVIEVTVDPSTDVDEIEYLGELLAERMGDNLDAVLGVNDRMADADMTRWHVGTEPAPPVPSTCSVCTSPYYISFAGLGLCIDHYDRVK